MIGDGFLGELDHGLQLPVVWQTPERGFVSQMSQKTRRDLEPARHAHDGLGWEVDPKSLEGDPGELATRPKREAS